MLSLIDAPSRRRAHGTPCNTQGSVNPTTIGGGLSMFSWKSGGLNAGQMWISLTWSATTAYRPDMSNVAIPAPPAAPSAPTLSQVAGGALGARTRFARIAYARSLNGISTLYPVSAESSLAISANNLLKITSPASVAGYDGYVVLVGSATNAEYTQNHVPSGFNTTDIILFGTDWTESTTGFATNNTQYDSVNWKSLTMVDFGITTSVWMYPYYKLRTGVVELAPFIGSGGNPIAAQLQLADGNLPLSTIISGSYGFQANTPGAGGSLSGTGGGGRNT